WQYFDLKEPFIYKLVPVVAAHMGTAYPELASSFPRVASVLNREEHDFLRTIERGLSLFEEAAERAAKTSGRISGKDIFDVYTTYGFPPDLTGQMAQERGLTVDTEGYERLMRQHEEKSRARVEIKGPAEALDALFDPFVEDVLDRETDDRLKWSTPTTTAGVVAVFSRDNQVVLVLDRTCFYVESGGQVGDRGTISTETGRLEVEGVARCRNAIIHVGHLIEGGIHVGQTVLLQVDPEREFTRKNHTATHLLHWALQKVLGDHVEQRGSKVKPDEFTFDF